MSAQQLDQELDLLARFADRPQEISTIFQNLDDADLALLCDASRRARELCAQPALDGFWKRRLEALNLTAREGGNYELFRNNVGPRIGLLREILDVVRNSDSYRGNITQDDAARLTFDYTHKQASEIDDSVEIPKNVVLEGVIYLPKPAHEFLTEPILDVYEFGTRTDDSVIPRRYISSLLELKRILDIRKPDAVNVSALTTNAEEDLRIALTKFYK